MTLRLLFFFLFPLFIQADTLTLKPDLILGEYGTGKLRFRQPGALTSDDRYLYIADEGNYRIQKISFSGHYAGEASSETAMFQSIEDIVVGAGNMLYASRENQKSDKIIQYNTEDMITVTKYNAHAGFLGYEKSGNLFILSAGEMLLSRFSLSSRHLEKIYLPPDVISLRPLDINIYNNTIWILTETRLIRTDIFGSVQNEIYLPEKTGNGFICIYRKKGIPVGILNNKVFGFIHGKPEHFGNISENILVGGAVVAKGFLWISDKNKHRLLRFVLP